MLLHPDLTRLRAPFPPGDIEWKPGAVMRDKHNGNRPTKALAMPYLTNRAIQDRLDDVCGPDGWRNEFKPAPEGGVLCGLSIRVTRYPTDADGAVVGVAVSEWVTKWDGSENTQVEAVKGGLSSAMKRAAVQWGIGRYLYGLPAQWVAVDERGRFAETPRLPGAARAAPQSEPPREPLRGADGPRPKAIRPASREG